MSQILIKKISITELETDAVVNAANSGLWEGGGVCGYPLEQAWEIAITACRNFIIANKDYDIDIFFAVLDDRIMAVGQSLLDKKD